MILKSYSTVFCTVTKSGIKIVCTLYETRMHDSATGGYEGQKTGKGLATHPKMNKINTLLRH